MILRHIVILSFIFSVRSQEQETCVLYTFGADYYELFDNVKNPCQSSWSSWALRNYDDVNFVGLHESGSYFIEAINNTQLSCVSSFNMWLTIGGFIEVNIYMLSTSNLDQFSAIVNLIDGNSGLGTVAGQGNFQPKEHFVPEWHTLRIYIDGSVSGLGYISFVGVVSSNVSILIVDSYRYVAPTIEPETCEIYEDNSTVTTETTPTQTTTETEPTTIITTEPTTTEPPSTTNTTEEATNSTTEAETTITITPEAEPTITTVTESTPTETESTTITEEATTIATTETVQTTSEEPNSTTNIETESTTVTENTTASELTSITESTTLITESTTLSTASTTLTTESASLTTESEPTIPELTTEISVTTSPQIGSSFWTPLTICMTITLSLILIILIGAISYLIGRNCRDKTEEDIVLSYYLDEGQWWFRLIPRAKMNKPSE